MQQPLKWHGGKHYLAGKLIELMPPHLHYVEPYFGGGAVLLERDPTLDWFIDEAWKLKNGDKVPSSLRGCSEVVNDIDGELMNFWRVLQSQSLFREFWAEINAIPFSETEWEYAHVRCRKDLNHPYHQAAGFFIRCRQSRAGKFDCFATLSRNRTRRGMNEQVSSWWTCIEGLPAVHARLKRVAILNRDALDVIRQQDGPKTLFYLDPPYLHETRVSTNDYKYEMTVGQHRELVAVIKQCAGKVMLSGYPNDLYDRELADWNRKDFRIDNKASGAKKKPMKLERVWMNF